MCTCRTQDTDSELCAHNRGDKRPVASLFDVDDDVILVDTKRSKTAASNQAKYSVSAFWKTIKTRPVQVFRELLRYMTPPELQTTLIMESSFFAVSPTEGYNDLSSKLFVLLHLFSFTLVQSLVWQMRRKIRLSRYAFSSLQVWFGASVSEAIQSIEWPNASEALNFLFLSTRNFLLQRFFLIFQGFAYSRENLHLFIFACNKNSKDRALALKYFILSQRELETKLEQFVYKRIAHEQKMFLALQLENFLLETRGPQGLKLAERKTSFRMFCESIRLNPDTSELISCTSQPFEIILLSRSPMRARDMVQQCNAFGWSNSSCSSMK